MQYDFTEDDRLAVLRFLNEGDSSVLEGDAVRRLFMLHDAVNRKMLSSFAAVRRDNEQVRRRLARFERHEETLCEKGEFECRGVDTLSVARCLMFCLQKACENAGIKCSVTMTKLQILLYDVYAGYLARYRTRLTVEIPRFFGYVDQGTGKRVDCGPWFWTVKDTLQDYVRRHAAASRADYDALYTLDPEAAGLCWGVAQKYCHLSENALFQWIRGSEPFRDAMPENNAGKFSKEFNDVLVYRWKRAQIAESELRRSQKKDSGDGQA